MDIFISWSGAASKIIAEAIYDHLPTIIQDIDPFLSSEIEKGEQWLPRITGQLKKTSYGIVCITPDNLESPWLLYEAGALSVNLNQADGDGSKVSTLLLELKPNDVKPPLSSLQATQCNKEDIFKLYTDINKATDRPIKLERLIKLFDSMWDDLKKKIAEAKSKIGDHVSNTRSSEDVLNEVLTNSRTDRNRLADLKKDIRSLRYMVKNIRYFTSDSAVSASTLSIPKEVMRELRENEKLSDEAILEVIKIISNPKKLTLQDKLDAFKLKIVNENGQ